MGIVEKSNIDQTGCKSLSGLTKKIFWGFGMGCGMATMFGLIFLGVFSRVVPHPPNWTAMNAIAVFGICYLGNLRSCLIAVFCPLLMTDMVLGFHSTMLFVYFSLGVISVMGYWLKPTYSLLPLACLVFFAITNAGAWLVDSMYPKTVGGLVACYVAGIPFLVNDLIGTMVYGSVLFGWAILCTKKTSIKI